MNASVTSAAEFFRAVEVKPSRFAFPLVIDTPDQWRTCDGETLVLLHTLYLHSEREESEGVFNARTVAMPDWWSPDHRETYRDKRKGTYVPAKWVTQGCTPFDAQTHLYERVTVNLETGEVIAAR